LVEKLADTRGQEIKYGGGDPNAKEMILRLSDLVARLEKIEGVNRRATEFHEGQRASGLISEEELRAVLVEGTREFDTTRDDLAKLLSSVSNYL
jgi:hypothetical protein